MTEHRWKSAFRKVSSVGFYKYKGELRKVLERSKVFMNEVKFSVQVTVKDMFAFLMHPAWPV